MAKKGSKAPRGIAAAKKPNPFQLRKAADADGKPNPLVHVIKKGVVCGTEKRGQATPRGDSPVRIVVDATAGFIPLWAEGTTLRWRFQERSFRRYQNPQAAKASLENLFGQAVLAWGDSVPV